MTIGSSYTNGDREFNLLFAWGKIFTTCYSFEKRVICHIRDIEIRHSQALSATCGGPTSGGGTRRDIRRFNNG